jgi:hypothetical protein
MEKRKREILNIVIFKLIANNISFNYTNKVIDVKGYFKLNIYSNNVIEIITNNYNKDFKFLSDVSDAFILDVIDRIIFNY